MTQSFSGTQRKKYFQVMLTTFYSYIQNHYFKNPFEIPEGKLQSLHIDVITEGLYCNKEWFAACKHHDIISASSKSSWKWCRELYKSARFRVQTDTWLNCTLLEMYCLITKDWRCNTLLFIWNNCVFRVDVSS